MSAGADNYPVAAVRYFVDEKILDAQGRSDNAVCHYAFSAECAIKNLYEQLPAQGLWLGHNIKENWEDIRQCCSILEVMHAKTGAALGQLHIPDFLFFHHPQRRYEDDGIYGEQGMKEAEAFTEGLVREIVMEALDGKILF